MHSGRSKEALHVGSNKLEAICMERVIVEEWMLTVYHRQVKMYLREIWLSSGWLLGPYALAFGF